MSTGTKIIEDALALIGAHSVAAPAEPESIARGRDRLNDMLEQWLSQKIVLNHNPLKDAGDDLAEPADTTMAITENLAIALSPLFDNGVGIVSPTLRGNANANYQIVKSLYERLTIPKKVVSSTTPKGEGNSRGSYNRVFFQQGETLGK